VKCPGTEYVGVERGRRWLKNLLGTSVYVYIIQYRGSWVVFELRETLLKVRKVRSPLDKGTNNSKVIVAV
jgi:hypothetical protein